MNNREASNSKKHHSMTEPNRRNKDKEGRSERPHDTWYYSSNHVLINRERMMRGIAPLMRTTAFDEVARKIAIAAAKKVEPRDVSTNQMFRQLKCDGTILQGPSIRAIHNRIMTTSSKGRDRILQESYQQFGIGTYKNADGVLFVVQIFSKIGRVEL
ncbi:hypothetical protein IV203_008357 [Nitzschia inconspicua]|uniref:Uncharacterized protein n=1 Tax=Nitzschia inconspicua TaxID=303405 RepID=A0A9K3KYD2_9STRA|nr:hypothetical protein IV203_008357 [Nitzschia inconspicua]